MNFTTKTPQHHMNFGRQKTTRYCYNRGLRELTLDALDAADKAGTRVRRLRRNSYNY
jgi:hypothetical protein